MCHVHVEIPLAISHGHEGTSSDQSIERITGLAEGESRHLLLVVDEKKDNRLLLRRLLEPIGFHIREAANGQEAVAQFEALQPDLIWMDIRMPVMNGLEATRRIKAIEKDSRTRIVALTAHALEEERLEILQAGFDGVVRKPYMEAEIFGALTEHLGVKFLSTEKPVLPSTEMEFEPHVGQLKKLPAELVEELKEAAVHLDEERCLRAAGIISDHEHELGVYFRTCVENMQYRKLLAFLDNLPGSKTI